MNKPERRTAPTLHLQVRVNGVPITKLTIRRRRRNGYPSDQLELVIHDPTIGSFAIHDGFELEIKSRTAPESAQGVLVEQDWQRVSPEHLIALLRGRFVI
jgi:hypothetical protein